MAAIRDEPAAALDQKGFIGQVVLHLWKMQCKASEDGDEDAPSKASDDEDDGDSVFNLRNWLRLRFKKVSWKSFHLLSITLSQTETRKTTTQRTNVQLLSGHQFGIYWRATIILLFGLLFFSWVRFFIIMRFFGCDSLFCQSSLFHLPCLASLCSCRLFPVLVGYHRSLKVASMVRHYLFRAKVVPWVFSCSFFTTSCIDRAM